MSVKIDLGELAAKIGEYGFAYLVTTSIQGPAAGRAHVLAVMPELAADGIVLGGIGRHTLANVADNPIATLVWPPVTEGGYSLIVDGDASAAPDDERVTVTPTKAILHRPALARDGEHAGTRVGNDCQTVPLTA